jgi:phosphoglycerol transferase MdoB-like AlkP superfamily enzyme
MGLVILAIRGGTQKKPLNLIHASEMTEVKNIPAIINTPFSIIKSFGKRNLVEIHYLSEKALEPLNKGIKKQPALQPFTRENVVIIIVESLSKKYLSFFGGNTSTPFLDSIFRESIVFTNAFANGKESIQGIPAILSSIPSWQNDPFIFSSYASNKITSLANVLKEKGYKTQFFHGGSNGTMGFDSYAKLAGFEQYFGRNEYNNENDFDGKWGIWDEPFLQFMAQELSNTSPPFFSTVFSLNTHHPFTIPEKHKNRFNKRTDPMLNCIEYLDFSLFRFFERIKNAPWFNNTLFIITADHTAPNTVNKYNSLMDEYRIPIAFYRPGDKEFKGTSPIIANQIDILPSVLSLLHYPEPYFTFGKNLFEHSKYRFAITYNAEIYQFIDSQFCYQFNGQNASAFYNWKADSNMNRNLLNGKIKKPIYQCDSTLKMMIQFFNHCMINNQMHCEMIKTNR